MEFEGNLYIKLKKFDDAIKSFNDGIKLQLYNGRYKGVMESNFGIAEAYLQQNKIDSAIKYANNVLELDKNYDFTLGVLNTYNLLYKAHKIKDFNNRKSSKEQTLNDLELIQRKIDAKLKSFRSN